MSTMQKQRAGPVLAPGRSLPPADAAGARLAILDDPVGSFGRVSVWRSLGDYLPNDDEPQPDELATVSFTLALASAATAVAEYASDKIASLHGRQLVNDSIAHVATELRAMARGLDITTGERLPRDPGADLVPGL